MAHRISRTHFCTVVLQIVLLLAFVRSATGQAASQNATLRGTVTDSSGAVVPGAVIVVENMGTNEVVRRVTTDGNGGFEVPALQPATYRLQVESRGFNTYKAESLALDPGETRRLTIELTVGAGAESVTVEAHPSVVNTETGKIDGFVQASTYSQLPLNDIYPFVISSLTLQPGIQGLGSYAFQVNGQSATQQSQGFDGAANDRLGDQFNNMNFVQEMSTTTANATADSARIAGYNLVSKSGTNQFHGSVYWRPLSSALNARYDLTPKKTPYLLNEFDGEISGPIIKNRTFFYASEMYQKIPLGSFVQASVPTPQMRAGDFSQISTVVVDPLNQVPFAGNIIPSSRISSVAQQAQSAYFPLPNLGASGLLVNNYGFTFPFNSDYRDVLWQFYRLDHRISEKHSLYGNYERPQYDYVLPGTMPLLFYTRERRENQLGVSETYVATPHLVNVFRWQVTWVGIIDGLPVAGQQMQQGPQAVKTIGLQGVNAGNLSSPGFPTMTISGVSTLTVSAPVNESDFDTNSNESLTWVKGKHVLKVGGTYGTFRVYQGGIANGAYGNFTFNGTFSKLGYADFLLGLPQTSSRLNPFTNRTGTNKELGLYVMDSFKVSQKLTVDYGLRWDYYALPTYTDGLMYNWDPKTSNVIVTANAATRVSPLYPTNINIVTGNPVPAPDKRNFRPRISAAYRLGKWVIRGGYGIFTERSGGVTTGGSASNAYFGSLLNGGPFQIAETYTNKITSGQPFFSFPNPFPASLASAAVPSQSITGYPLQTHDGAIHQMNLTLEREIQTIGIRASYIGTFGSGLNYTVGIDKPTASAIPFAQSRLPYPQFVGVTYDRYDGQSRYDALQVQAQRRVGFVQINAHWTFANAMANYLDTQDPYNVTNNWSRVSVRRQYAVIQTEWKLPFGKGSAPMNHLVKDWTAGTITYFGTGTYFSPSFSGSDPSGTNTSGGLPNRVCDGNLPAGQRTIAEWFNPACFTVPAPGGFGNSGVNVLEGPRINVTHLHLAREFNVTERMRVTFAASATNVFNHPHFNVPQSNISTPGAGQLTSAVTSQFIAEHFASRTLAFQLKLAF